jgi:hypothetical protein
MWDAVVVLARLRTADWIVRKGALGPTRRVPAGQPESGLRVGCWHAARLKDGRARTGRSWVRRKARCILECWARCSPPDASLY